MEINRDKIVEAVAASSVAPIAKEAAVPLLLGEEGTPGWVDRFADEPRRIIAVECPFFMWLDKWTLVVGVLDEIAEWQGDNERFLFGSEWKTTKAASGKRFNEEKWLGYITTGPQLPIYALALHEGTFKGAGKVELSFPVHIRVRAAVKSSPPEYWPAESSGFYKFEERELTATKNAILARAEAIRAMRVKRLVPWQTTGSHCRYHYGRDCVFLSDICAQKEYEGHHAIGALESSDPGNAGITLAGVSILDHDPRLVVLSSSTYTTSLLCLEKWRLVASRVRDKEETLEMQIGTAFHAGVAEFGRQIMQQQKESEQ